MKNNMSCVSDKIMSNICSILNCSGSDIKDVYKLDRAYTNQSYHFSYRGKEYVYRHPGKGTGKYLSRRSEAFSLKVAYDLGLDKTTVYIDTQFGWKIAKFIPCSHALCVDNKEELRKALNLLRKLHTEAIVSPFNHFVWDKSIELLEQLSKPISTLFLDFDYLRKCLSELYLLTEKEGVPKILCHGDFFDQNIIFDYQEEPTILDWEYSGNDDPASDLGTLICCSECGNVDVIDILRLYYGHEPSLVEIRHVFAYVAITAFYWLIWGADMFFTSNNQIYRECAMKWHRISIEYYLMATDMYQH